MTDPYSSPRYPTDPLEPAVPAGHGTVPVPPAPRYGAQESTPLHDAPLGATSSTDSTDSIDGAEEKAAHVAATAKDEAAGLAGAAKEAAGSVLDAEKTMAHDTASEATDRAKETFAEAKTQVKDLWAQSRSELSEGASVQLQRLSVGARAVSDELSTMASASDDPGIASSLARRASGYLATAGDWLEDRGPDEVSSDVARYARRSPGTFLAIAAGLGLVVGRVARSLKDDAGDAPGVAADGTAPSTTTASHDSSDDRGTVPRTTAYTRPAGAYGTAAVDPFGTGDSVATDGSRTAGHVPTSSLPGSTSLDGGDAR